MIGRLWTEDEDATLRDLWKTMGAIAIGKQLGRTMRGIRARACLLHLGRNVVDYEAAKRSRSEKMRLSAAAKQGADRLAACTPLSQRIDPVHRLAMCQPWVRRAG